MTFPFAQGGHVDPDSQPIKSKGRSLSKSRHDRGMSGSVFRLSPLVYSEVSPSYWRERLPACWAPRVLGSTRRAC